MRAYFPLVISGWMAFAAGAAADQNLDAAIGGAVGGGLGAYVGNRMGGPDGAAVGGALGAAAGAAVATRGVRGQDSADYGYQPDAYYDDPPSRFCPPGQAKKGRC